MHIFSDASEKAYGSVVYLRSINREHKVTVALLCSKSRVAPTKMLTIPRLELQAAKLSIQLYNRVKIALKNENFETYFWTDSEIVLNWIHADSTSYNTFVANRISFIQ